jgi:hypothetical protein
MPDSTRKCKQMYEWSIKRYTRKAKSSNKNTRKNAKKVLLDLTTKKQKSMFMKKCKSLKFYDNKCINNEKEFNKEMNKVEKMIKKMDKNIAQ